MTEMSAEQWYVVLTLATCAIAWLTIELYRRARHVTVVVNALLLYYFSLVGAWRTVGIRSGGETIGSFGYLGRRLYPLNLDGDYLLAIILYTAFIGTILVTPLIYYAVSGRPRGGYFRGLSGRRPKGTGIRGGVEAPAVVVNLQRLSVMCGVAAVACAMLIAHNFGSELLTKPLYSLRNTTAAAEISNELYWLMTIITCLSAVGLSVSVSGGSARLVACERPLRAVFTLLFLIGVALAFMMGSKAHILRSIVLGATLYISNARAVRVWRFALVVTCLGLTTGVVDITRDFGLDGAVETVRSADTTLAMSAVERIAGSGEQLAAHTSLYAVLHSGVQPRYGWSFYSLLMSAVPRVMWPGRPGTVYSYYRSAIGAPEDQGFTIHHATGWYLTLGFPGIAVGAIVYGLVWTYAMAGSAPSRPERNARLRIMRLVLPFVFVALTPSVVRDGIEGYKSLATDVALICLPLGAAVSVNSATSRRWGVAAGQGAR